MRPDPQQAEVAGAAAEIGDQHQFVTLQPAFVVIGRRDRLKFEPDFGHSCQPEGVAQPVQRHCFRILAGFADEMRRPAHDDGLGQGAGGCFRLGLQVLQDQRHQRFDAELLAEDVGAGEILRSQIGFHRLDEPPLALAVQVGLDRLRSGPMGQGRTQPVLLLLEEQDGSEGLEDLGADGQRHQP